MRLHFSVLLSAVLFFSFQGCIKERPDYCHYNVRVRFDFTLAAAQIEEVGNVKLFLFDDMGMFCGVWRDMDISFGPYYEIVIPYTSSGNYTFVAWAMEDNLYLADPYVMSPEEHDYVHIDDLRFVYEKLSKPQILSSDISPLFYGSATVHLVDELRQDVVVSLIRNTNTINVRTEGLLPSSDSYSVEIIDDNGIYYFDNTFAPSEELNYYADCAITPQGQLTASLDVLRIISGRSPIMTITNRTTNTVIYSVDLVTLFDRIPGINYDLVFNFDVVVGFSAGIVANVEVNDWTVVDEGHII